MHELTQQEKDFINNQARAFWKDLEFTVYKGAVISYVHSHRSSFDYVTCMGVYENPQDVLDAVLAYPGYADRDSTSARTIVGMGRLYKLEDDAYKAQRCEDAIAYWQKNYVPGERIP